MSLKANKSKLYVFLFILTTYFLFFSGHVGGDALWNYYTAESVFKDGNFDLGDSVEEKNAGELTGSFNAIAEEIRILSSQNHKVYSKHGLGQIITGSLFYGTGLIFTKILPFIPRDFLLIFFFSMQNIFITALICTVFFSLLKLLEVDNKKAALITGSLTFGTMLFTYAVKSGFGEPLAALFILLALFMLIKFEYERKSSLLLYAGIFTGCCLLTKLYTVLLFPAFFIYLFYIIYQNQKDKAFLCGAKFIIGFIIPVSLFLLYNYVRFGNVFQTGYSVQGTEGTTSTELIFNIYYGIANFQKIFLSSGKGLLIFNPMLILSFFGIRKLYVNNKGLFLFYVSACIPYVVFFTFSTHWASYGAWGARYFVPILPVLCLPIVYLIKYSNTPEKINFQKILLLIATVGLFIQLPSTVMNFSAYERFLVKESPHDYYTRIDMPQYSQIGGSYYLLFSGINRLATGESLNFPLIMFDKEDIKNITMQRNILVENFTTGAIFWRSLKGFDWFDLWYVQVFKMFHDRWLLKAVTGTAIVFIMFLLVILYKKVVSIMEV
jgi:hypothetical protein